MPPPESRRSLGGRSHRQCQGRGDCHSRDDSLHLGRTISQHSPIHEARLELPLIGRLFHGSGCVDRLRQASVAIATASRAARPSPTP